SPTATIALAGGGLTGGPPAGGAVGQAGAGGVTVAGAPAAGTIGLGDLGSSDVLRFAWLVPGTLLGLPGLILLVLGMQAALAGAFVPLTRRVFAERGGGGPTG
ncbi:MAG: hypothetical protein ACHQZR_08365, partial [Candidatus Limnocylindrales bacterium]